jgi:hypothetical protein
METYKPETNSKQAAYREKLAEQLKAEPDFFERRELLEQARKTREYEEARKWKEKWRAEYIENRSLARARIEKGLISEDEAKKSQYEITDKFLTLLAAEPKLEALRRFADDPSPFVRYEVATLAKQIGSEEILAMLENDENPEIRHLARRALAETEVRGLLPHIEHSQISLRLSDLFASIPVGEGTRFFVIQKADREQLRQRYNVTDDDIKNLQLNYHFKQNEQVDLMWWGLIDIRHLPGGRKAWLLEEIQSDILQKTKNKKLKEEFFEPCENCAGRGVVQKTKREQEKCPICQGASLLPKYPRQLLESLKRLAEIAKVDILLMPTSESMVQKYAGLLKPTKAKLLYDTIPSRFGFKRQTIGVEIEFGQEDGGRARANEFWMLSLTGEERK